MKKTIVILTTIFLGATSASAMSQNNKMEISIVKTDEITINEDVCLQQKVLKKGEVVGSAPFKVKEGKKDFDITLTNEVFDENFEFKIAITDKNMEDIQYIYDTSESRTNKSIKLNLNEDREYRVLIENNGKEKIENINLDFHFLHEK